MLFVCESSSKIILPFTTVNILIHFNDQFSNTDVNAGVYVSLVSRPTQVIGCILVHWHQMTLAINVHHRSMAKIVTLMVTLHKTD